MQESGCETVQGKAELALSSLEINLVQLLGLELEIEMALV